MKPATERLFLWWFTIKLRKYWMRIEPNRRNVYSEIYIYKRDRELKAYRIGKGGRRLRKFKWMFATTPITLFYSTRNIRYVSPPFQLIKDYFSAKGARIRNVRVVSYCMFLLYAENHPFASLYAGSYWPYWKPTV